MNSASVGRRCLDERSNQVATQTLGVALCAGVASLEKHAIDEAPAGIGRKAAWLRGASQRKLANLRNSRPAGERA